MHKNVDLRSELITFRATMTGVFSTLSLCSELLQRKDDRSQRLLEHERERRRKLEHALLECQEKLRESQEQCQHQTLKRGPDFMEGPHSVIRDDEFLDAFEGELDRMEREEMEKGRDGSCKSTQELTGKYL